MSRSVSGACRFARILFVLVLTAGCRQAPEQALGTLEWDRINGRAPASEIIVDIFVTEGQQVAAGQELLQFDNRKIAGQVDEQRARLEQARWRLAELESGPRPQTIAEAAARLEAARATLANDQEIFRRQKQLFETDFTSQEQLDIARSRYLTARERVNELSQRLDELQAGTRKEQIEQARAQVDVLQAQLDRLTLQLEEYTIKATRDGRVDSIIFKKGDRPPAQAVVTTVLAGEHPWARIYIPAPFRPAMVPGARFSLKIDGRQDPVPVELRTIASDPAFSPYYALSERDRSRLTYVAEFDLLDDSGDRMAAGLPAQLMLDDL